MRKLRLLVPLITLALLVPSRAQSPSLEDAIAHLDHAVTVLGQIKDLDEQTINELVGMTTALTAMHDARIDAVMLPFIKRAFRYQIEVEKLRASVRPLRARQTL